LQYTGQLGIAYETYECGARTAAVWEVEAGLTGVFVGRVFEEPACRIWGLRSWLGTLGEDEKPVQGQGNADIDYNISKSTKELRVSQWKFARKRYVLAG